MRNWQIVEGLKFKNDEKVVWQEVTSATKWLFDAEAIVQGRLAQHNEPTKYTLFEDVELPNRTAHVYITADGTDVAEGAVLFLRIEKAPKEVEA